MKTRYMKSDADRDLIDINATLAHCGHDRYMAVKSRNGYQGLDLYSSDHTCIRTLVTGTPRECIGAANSYAADIMFEILRKGD